MPLHTRILIGLVVGALAGALMNAALGAEHDAVVFINRWIAGPLGQIFLRMMFMVVMPLVFASIALGVAGIGDLRRFGVLGVLTLGTFLLTTAVAGTIGIASVLIARPGDALAPETRQKLLETFAADAQSKVQASKAASLSIDTFVNIVTRNPLKSAVEGDMLGVIFFGIMVGVALTLIAAERARLATSMLEVVSDVVAKIVEIAMRFAPFGVAALIFTMTSRFGFSLLKPLGLFAVLVIAGLILQALLLIVFVRVTTGLSPTVLLQRVEPAIVTAFSTSSSNATLPTNIAVVENRLGVPPKIAGFVLPLGATMNMNGTALFEGVTVLFLCQVFGVDLAATQMLIVVGLTVITAIGAAGVPGGSIPLLVGILAMFGVPPEGIAIVLGIDRLLDMSRTTVNVFGDATTSLIVSKILGEWDPSKVPASIDPPIDETPPSGVAT